jgi:hypothetical protein
MASEDGQLRRYPRGYWVAGFPHMDEFGRPDGHHCGRETLLVLERRGLIERTNMDAAEWRDSRQLTDLGRQVAIKLAAQKAQGGAGDE